MGLAIFGIIWNLVFFSLEVLFTRYHYIRGEYGWAGFFGVFAVFFLAFALYHTIQLSNILTAVPK